MSDEDVLNSIRVDRSVVSECSLTDPPGDSTYWLARTPEERLLALQLMRRISYGDAVTGRLQRVLEVIEREPR